MEDNDYIGHLTAFISCIRCTFVEDAPGGRSCQVSYERALRRLPQLCRVSQRCEVAGAQMRRGLPSGSPALRLWHRRVWLW
eukprot:scaffold111335_cov44-Prasinocladus_malaysianus.AAC.1